MEDNDNTPRKRIRRLKGVFETNERGFLSIPHDQWGKLDADDKAFVQKYNAKVKHQEPLASLKVPDGITIKTKSRRNQASTPDDTTNENDSSESSSPPPSKKLKKGTKNIRFAIQHSDQDDE
jgi:hypothetical protein